ncbi:MAG TPA: right-handed parallel beta-helix repeat-containing protein [Devosia sp.]|nr:right-handed parallel beta-helix repeat-containing protein [Devosia sp.]
MTRLSLALFSLVFAGLTSSALAADAAKTTLESDLAPEITADLVATFDKANKAEPGFETFQSLYLAFETVRKWQAFLDASHSAGLSETNGPFAAIETAVSTLEAHGISRVSVATAAIEKLAGLTDWHAANQAQAQLVINELGVLLTEISEPTQRIRGQLVLAGVELGTTAPEAARMRVDTAIHDLGLVTDPQLELDFARRLIEIVLTLKSPQTIEIASEIVAAISDAAGRVTITDEIAASLATAEAARLVTADARDPLAMAWSYQAARVGGGGDLDTAIRAVAGAIDPLPVVVLLASGVEDTKRREICASLVGRMISEHASMRALNLRKMLPPEDCGTETALTLAAAFAGEGFTEIARPLLSTALAAMDEGGFVPADPSVLATTLTALGGYDLVAAHADALDGMFEREALAAMAGRAAVTALLGDPGMGVGADAAPLNSALSGYAPAGLMASVLTGRPARAGAPGAWDDADRLLMRSIGIALGPDQAASQRLIAFLHSDNDLGARLALAEGITADQGFHIREDDGLTGALMTLDAMEGVPPHPLLSAALGTLDITSLPPDAAGYDEILRRLARHAAWAGEAGEAQGLAGRAADPASILLDVAAIGGVLGDFEQATDSIRAAPVAADRVTQFRFLARARAEDLDSEDWMHATRPATSGGPVRVIRAATTSSQTSTVIKTSALTVSLLGSGKAPAAPPMPDLDVESIHVTSIVPYPGGGGAGIAVGGEGRYVRLARFESQTFDGLQNNGVRDYVYQQNKTITPEFVFLNDGIFSIADVIAGIGRSDTSAITQLPDGVVRFNRPVAIGPDATLIISGEEVSELQINGTLGAYIVNAGRLYITGTKVVAYDTDRNGPAYVEKGASSDKFRPFILSWSASETYVADSEFVAMGYSAGRSYGLSLTSGPDDDYFARAQAVPPTGIIVNNSFDNSYYGFYAYEADGVRVLGNEYRNSIIYGIDPHDRSRHLNMSLNAAYGTFKKHGIIISREVDDSFIVGNLSFDNHGSGIMLDRASVGTVIAGNTIRHNEGDGIAVFESPCTLIGANDVSFNQRSGVLVRNSWDVNITANRIEANKSAGVQGFISDLSIADGSEGRNFEVDPYQPFTTLTVRNNAIASNGAGIQTAGVSSAEIFDNRFKDQSKRLFGGDLDGLNAVLLQHSSAAPTLVSTNCRPVITTPRMCQLTELGAVPALTLGTYAPGNSGDYCLADAASPQAAAFNGGAQ